MKKRRIELLTALIVVLIVPILGMAQATECESVNLRVKTVAKNTSQLSTVDFSASGGGLDPNPVLQTQIQVFSRTCVVVYFSTQADPLDNHIVFQASINDVPMEGHSQFPYLTPAPTTPVVWDPEETNLNVSRMLSYTFFATVGPGMHTVRIRFAGCCSGVPGGNSGLVRQAVMSISF